MSSSPARVSPTQGQQPTTPTSPSSPRSRSRSRLSTTLAVLGAKIANTLNLTPEHERASDHPHSGNTSPAALGPTMTRYNAGTKEKVDGDEASLFTLSTQERSVSRGRDAFQSSGRGGVGNIRRTSVSRDARPDSGPDDFSTTRGREPRPTTGQEIFSTGRGGAGNMRSPSREVRSGPAASTVDAVEDQVIRSHKAAEQIAVHSTGRGGIGNMASSRSRSRARESTPSLHPPHHPHHPNGGASGTHAPSLHSTGRGGAGNILSGHTPSVAEADENQGGKHLDDEIHSTGRGGAANIVLGHIPPVEHTHHLHGEGAYESTGRGGAGNIVHT